MNHIFMPINQTLNPNTLAIRGTIAQLRQTFSYYKLAPLFGGLFGVPFLPFYVLRRTKSHPHGIFLGLWLLFIQDLV